MADQKTQAALVREAERLGFPALAPWLREGEWPVRDEHRFPIERLNFFLGRTLSYCAAAQAVGRGEEPLRVDGRPYKCVKDARARARRHLQYFVLGRLPTGRWDAGSLILPLLAEFRLANTRHPKLLAEIDAHAAELARAATAFNRESLLGPNADYMALGDADVLRPGESAVYVACDSVLLPFLDDHVQLTLKIGETGRDVWGRALELKPHRTGRSGNLVVLRIWRVRGGTVAPDYEYFHEPLSKLKVPWGNEKEPGRGREFRDTTLALLDDLARANKNLVEVPLPSARQLVVPDVPALTRKVRHAA